LFEPPNALQACSSGDTGISLVSDNYTGKYRIPKLQKWNMSARPYAFCMGFNNRLKEARLASGLTGAKLGEAIGCSKQNISHWEAGRFEPNLGYLAALCQVLDVPADWLLLGKVPEELSVGALREARFYDALSPEGKRKWEMAKMLFREGVPDLEVEDRMQETKRFKYQPKAEKSPLLPADARGPVKKPSGND
jgi:transcriptional regulator with XRE-family HTH domain